MKKLMMAVAVLAVCGFSVNAQAQAKIGVVNADQVIYESARGKAFLKELESYAKQKEEEIKAVVTEAQQVQKEYQSKLASLSDEKRAEMEKQLSDYQIRVKRMQDDGKREFQIKQQEGFERFRKILEPIVTTIAKEKGLDLVFSRGQSGIVYLSPAVDLTSEVIKRFDAQ